MLSDTAPSSFQAYGNIPKIVPLSGNEFGMNLDFRLVNRLDWASLLYIRGLYEASFPRNEQRPWAQLLRLLSRSEAFRLYLLCEGENPVGFISYWLWSDLLYIEHFAMAAEQRGKGYGSAALRTLCVEISRPMVLEVEPPVTEQARRRIAFYRRLGFVRCELPYSQPAYSETSRPVELSLMFYTAPVAVGSEDFPAYFSSVRQRLYEKVYGVSLPDGSEYPAR